MGPTTGSGVDEERHARGTWAAAPAGAGDGGLRGLRAARRPQQPGYSRLWEVGVYNLVLWCVLGLCVARAIRQPSDRVTWVLIATGIAGYAIGTLVFSVWLQPMAVIPYPSVSDALWLAFYPLALTGLGLAARRRIVGGTASLSLDGIIAGLGLAAAGAVACSTT